MAPSPTHFTHQMVVLSSTGETSVGMVLPENRTFGLIYNATTGTITGTPIKAFAEKTFTFEAVDSDENTRARRQSRIAY